MTQHPYLELTIESQRVLLRDRAKGAVDPRPAALTLAREALKQARADYRTFKFTEGVMRLSQAQNRLAAEATSPDDFALLIQLALQRGLAQLALKIPSEAEQAFATAYLLGYLGPATGDHPPEVEAVIKRAGEQLSSATKGGLTIKVRPKNAHVHVDGKRLGHAPVTAQVRPGLHHVRITCTGQSSKAFFHRVSSGRMERLEIYLKPAAPAVAALQLLQVSSQGESLDTVQHREALGRLFGTGSIVLHAMTAGGLVKPKLVPLGGAAAAPDASRCSASSPERVARCLGPLLYQQATGRPHDPGRAKTAAVSKPLYKRWWFWTIVGAGVVGAAGATTGIYFATQADSGTNVDLQVD